MNTDLHFSSATPEWSTPLDFYQAVEKKFGRLFLDVCATAENTKCENFIGRPRDGLTEPWARTNWLNPPYGRGIGAWLDKAAMEARNGNLTLALVPARTDTKWFRAAFDAAEHLYFIPGRLKFGGCENSAPFPSALFLFESALGAGAETYYWDWKVPVSTLAEAQTDWLLDGCHQGRSE